MPRTLAEERIKLTLLTVKPVNVLKPTLTELAAGKDIQCKTLRNDTRLSATGSETFSEPLSCEGGNPTDFGASNFEGSITLFRFLDEDGLPVALEDDGWDLLGEKGTEIWAYQRTGPLHDKAWATTDVDVEYFHFTTDNPQHPSDISSGYIKKVIPLGIKGDSKVTGITIMPAGGGS